MSIFDEFMNQEYTKAVYWGSNSQRIIDRFFLDAFSLYQLIKLGKLLFGVEKRNELNFP